MSEGTSKKTGEEIKLPVFIWYKSFITGRLQPAICYDFIDESTKTAIVFRRELTNHAILRLGVDQCAFMWPAPKDN